MTNYILGAINPTEMMPEDEGTFKSPHQIYFYENYPSSYIDVEVIDKNGNKVIKPYNVAKRMFKEDE